MRSRKPVGATIVSTTGPPPPTINVERDHTRIFAVPACVSATEEQTFKKADLIADHLSWCIKVESVCSPIRMHESI